MLAGCRTTRLARQEAERGYLCAVGGGSLHGLGERLRQLLEAGHGGAPVGHLHTEQLTQPHRRRGRLESQTLLQNGRTDVRAGQPV